MEATEIPTQQTNLEHILDNLDQSFHDTGIKPSEAWRYREEVRAKYNLPECGYRWDNPIRYIQTIEELLRKEGVEIREKHEFAQFFKENPTAGALSSGPNVFRDNSVIVGNNHPDGEWWGLRARANQLAHESVHALQKKKYPRMPDEEAEKEAYFYQRLTPEQITNNKDDPESFQIILGSIESSIQDSVRINQKINEKTK